MTTKKRRALSVDEMIADIKPRWRNKLNGILYFKSSRNVKYIDGVKYVQVSKGLFFDSPVWIRADILERVPE